MVTESPTLMATRTGAQESGGILTAEQLIERIQALNPTAGTEYLSRFSREALMVYLEHMTSALEPRGRTARWTRPGDTPAIVRYVPED